MFYQIDYSSVRRMPTVKLSGQTQGTTTNTMPTSTSLQDISSHHAEKFSWNNNNNNNNDNNNNNNNTKDQRLVNFSEKLLSTTKRRPLKASQSDERIFEHPEVTIIPSALDDELQRRSLTIKTSNTTDNLERDGGQSTPNILEHPDMRSPVIMQPQQISSSTSSSALLIYNDYKRLSRTQSTDVNTTVVRTPSPGNRVEFFIDNQKTSQRSVSPGLIVDNIIENPEQEKNENFHVSSSLTTATDSIREYSKTSSNSDIKKNDSW